MFFFGSLKDNYKRTVAQEFAPRAVPPPSSSRAARLHQWLISC
jgi:hypothetical protein